MKNLISSFICLSFLFLHNIKAQTLDKPWSFSVNSNILNLLGNNLEDGINFGGPALGLSRLLSSGLCTEFY